MTVMIIGAPEEQHSAFIHQKLQARGVEAFYFDSRRFPGELCLSLEPNHPNMGSIRPEPGRPPIPLNRIRSVYWRYLMGIETAKDITDPFMQNMTYREIESAVGCFFRMLDCLWVNGAEAIHMHMYKIYQLQLLARQGIRVPDTLVTNHPDDVMAFYEKHEGHVIYKPVRGGAHTEKLKPEDLKPERLKELAKAPVQFQEMIDGVDVRVYLIGDELFPAEIRSRTLDFRDDPQAAIVPVTLPDAVAEDCRRLAKTLGLLYSGIDVRHTPDGEYVFLEGNPAPMFIHFENQSRYPISDRLVDLLLSPGH